MNNQGSESVSKVSDSSSALDESKIKIVFSRKRKLDYTDEKEEKDDVTGRIIENTSCSKSKTHSHEEPNSEPTSVSVDDVIKQLKTDLKKEEERLRKLKMVKMYREKNNLEELEQLIDKWRTVCQESVEDLRELLPPPTPSLKELLDHLQIDHGLVHFDPDVESF